MRLAPRTPARLWWLGQNGEEVAMFVVQETINFIRLFANRICPLSTVQQRHMHTLASRLGEIELK